MDLSPFFHRSSFFGIRLFLDLPDTVDDCAIDPFDERDDLFAELRRSGRAAAHRVDLFLDVFDRPDRQIGALDSVDEVRSSRVDGDAALGDDDVDELTGPARQFCHPPMPCSSLPSEGVTTLALKSTSISVAPRTTASMNEAKQPLP